MAFTGFGQIVPQFGKLTTTLGKVTSYTKILVKQWKDFAKQNREVQKKWTEGTKNVVSVFSKIAKLPGITGVIKLLSQLLGGTIAPGLSAFMEAMERIGEILGIILIPLKPFLDLLSIIAAVLEAALAPMLGEIYTLLQPVIEELVEMIPALTEAVIEWLEADEGLFEAIESIIESLPLLLEGLIAIIPKLGEMVVIFAKQMLPMLIKLIPSFLDLAILFAKELFPALVKIMPDLMKMVDAFIRLFTALAPLAGQIASIIDVLSWFIGGLMGAFLGMSFGPAGMLAGFLLGTTLDIARAIGTAEGGIFTRPEIRLIGEAGPEAVVPLEDEDSPVGGITINIQGNVLGNDEFIDGLIGELQRRRALGMM